MCLGPQQWNLPQAQPTDLVLWHVHKHCQVRHALDLASGLDKSIRLQLQQHQLAEVQVLQDFGQAVPTL